MYSLTQNQNYTLKESTTLVESVLGTHKSLKNLFNKSFVEFIIWFLNRPFGYFWIRRSRVRLEKHMKKSLPKMHSSDDYLYVRKQYDELLLLKPHLEKFDKIYDLKKRFKIKYSTKQLSLLAQTILQYIEMLETTLHDLDTENPPQTVLGHKFRIIPEAELWEKRNKAYQYWM